MTTQLIAPSRPAPGAPGPARHRRTRTAAAIAGVAALIATGGYVATTTFGPDAAPPTPATSTDVNPSAQTLRELRQSIAGQYGNQPATNETSRAQAMREMRDTVANLYGSGR